MRFLLLTLYASSAFCFWNPNQLISEGILPDSKRIKEKSFLQLKADILTATKKSHCTLSKASLIMDLLILESPKKCVEVGVFEGGSFLPIAATIRYLGNGEVIGIDAWSTAEAVKYIEPNDSHYKFWKKANLEKAKAFFYKSLDRWNLTHFSIIIEKPSLQASKSIESIDFLHLDGNCSQESSMEDATTFLPKLSIGGYVLASNMYAIVNNDRSKVEVYEYFTNYCEIISIIDDGDTILFRKTKDTL